jgi:hypothetical protein
MKCSFFFWGFVDGFLSAIPYGMKEIKRKGGKGMSKKTEVYCVSYVANKLA